MDYEIMTHYVLTLILEGEIPALLFQFLFQDDLNAPKDLKRAHKILEKIMRENVYIFSRDGLSMYGNSENEKNFTLLLGQQQPQ